MTRISFPLSDGFVPVVAKGTDVSAGSLLAHNLAPVEHAINIPEALGIDLHKVKNVLVVNLGDTVTQGDIIAEKKNFFGKRQAAVVSSVAGTILKYERDTGNLVIRTDTKIDSNELISPVAGKVDLCNNKEIVIATENAVAGLEVSSGTQSEGELFLLAESFQDNTITNVLYYLDNRAIGKVVLGGALSRDLLVKGHGIGVAGFVGTGIGEEDINYLNEKNISLPVIVVNEEGLGKLKKQEGKKVKVDAKNRVVIFLNN